MLTSLIDIAPAAYRRGANQMRQQLSVGSISGEAMRSRFPRKEIMHLAERFESRADHLDRRARSTTTPSLA
jgi:hypothetical protein